MINFKFFDKINIQHKTARVVRVLKIIFYTLTCTVLVLYFFERRKYRMSVTFDSNQWKVFFNLYRDDVKNKITDKKNEK